MPIDSGTQLGGQRPGVCTSATRPTNPYVGQQIFETNTLRTYTWDGTQWSRIGCLGAQTLVAAFTTVANHTTPQANGMTLTLDEPVHRQLRLTISPNIYMPGGAVSGFVIRLLRNGVATRIWSVPIEAMSTGNSHGMTFVYHVADSAGGVGVIWSVQIHNAASNTSVADYADVTTTRQFTIDDLGPA